MKKIIIVALIACFIFSCGTINLHAIDEDVGTEIVNQETIDDDNQDSSNDEESLVDDETNQEISATDEDSNIGDEDSLDEQLPSEEETDQTVVSSSVSYSTHVQDLGWQGYVKDGKLSGTSGKSKRLEGIKIKLIDNTISGSISYATHIQDIGWSAFVSDDSLSGTTGRSLRLEAIKIKLTGEIANYYDVYYRVHVQNFGWLDWTSNGKAAGSASYSYRLEAIEIKLVKKNEAAPGNTNKPYISPGKVYYSAHVQDLGWQNYMGDGKTAGTVGKAKRVEAIRMYLDNYEYDGQIEYNVSVQGNGWQGYKSNGSLSGTTGQNKRIEAIRIKLKGEIAEHYDVYYRVHIQNYGWLSWANNDEIAGSEGYGYRIEAIQVLLVDKNDNAPGDTKAPCLVPGKIYYATHVEDYGWLSYSGDGKLNGTTGKAKRIEALKINIDNLGYSGNVEYSVYVQNQGWQSYRKNGEVAGTTGKKLRIEAIRIQLTGEISNHYDVYYRVHVQNLGWLDWAVNNGYSGTISMGCRLEAIQVVLVEKNGQAPGKMNNPFVQGENIFYSTHVQGLGWINQVSNGAISGTTGKNYRLEAIKISLDNDKYSGDVEYSVHVQDIGWMDYVKNGDIAGTESQSKRIEAIKIRLTGEIANYYDISYRVYVQNIGWLDWTSNDREAGTVGGSFRVEAIQIKTMLKGSSTEGISNKAYLKFSEKNGYLVCYDSDGKVCENIEGFYKMAGPYDLRVNKATNVITVLAPDGNGKRTIAYKRFVCSVGYPTPSGVFYTPAKYRWKELMGPSWGQYSTRIVNGYLFHSVPYNRNGDIYSLSARMYNQLGTTCSHGCVRLTVADAKWIYDNCPLQTKVIIVDGGLDPLSKPSAQKIPITQTWDPTDPAIY